MMRANELRIGNLVWLSDKNKHWEILDGHEIDECNDNPMCHPIGITPRWLENFGFQYAQNACWEMGAMRIYNLSEENRPIFRIALAGHELTIVKHVHQLQNFYFALTSQELKLNDK